MAQKCQTTQTLVGIKGMLGESVQMVYYDLTTSPGFERFIIVPQRLAVV